MLQRFLIAAIVIIGLCFTLAPGALAQECVRITDWWPYPDGYPPGWFYYGPYPGTYVVLIAAHTSGHMVKGLNYDYLCGPADSSQEETCPTCPHPSAGSPISLGTGNTFIKENDINLPGLGGGLALTRTWNSMWPSNEIAYSVGIFGQNWRSTYEERVFMGSDNWLKYSRGDGSYWSFGVTQTGPINQFVPAAPSNISATLTAGTSIWALVFQNGEQRIFDKSSGFLTSIIDRNGNTTQIGYDASGRLSTITDPASRHLYFNYGSGPTHLLVTSVTSDFGMTFSYSYDSSYRLAQITRPDQTTIVYTYNSQSLIASVTDQNGKVLESHTYDSKSRGLTSSRANGVEAVSVTYPQ